MAIDVGKVFDTEKTVINYENLGIGRLIYQLPTILCQMFLQEVFKKNPIDALDQETLLTINKFFENNLNVSETARKLFVHRNTLVYRLEKIKKLTGLDLREFWSRSTSFPGESSPDNCTECKRGPLSAARRTEALFVGGADSIRFDGSANSGAVRKPRQRQTFNPQGPSGPGLDRTQALLILRAGRVLIRFRRIPRRMGSRGTRIWARSAHPERLPGGVLVTLPPWAK